MNDIAQLKKENKKWSKSSTMNGVTKKMEVRQIENGFIVLFEKYGRDQESDTYVEETKEIFSKTNPLDEMDEIDETIQNIDSMKKSLYSPSIFE
jgi:hypothetical protein